MANNRAQLLITAVDETRGAFASIKRNLGGLADAAKSVNGLLANLGVALSAGGLAAMVKSSLDSADALSKLSQRVGITVESLSTLIPVADLAGVSAEQFEGGLRKLATRMFEAATGSEAAARSFAAVGVSVRGQDGALRATDQVLLDLADRFKAMPDGAAKSALAVELFGKSGAELIPFLNQGRDGVEALAAELKALGVELGGDTAAQAEVFNDALAKVRLAVTSIGNRILEAFLPAMVEMAEGLVAAAKEGGTLRRVLDGIVLALKTVALGAATVGKAFVALGEAIGAGMAAAVSALSGNVSGARAIIAELKGSLVARLDELAEFRESLFDPKPIEVKAPGIRPEAGLLDRMTAGRASRDDTAARAALAKAQMEAEFRILKDGLDRAQRAFDAALEDRLVSIRDYQLAKTTIEQQAIDAEISRLEAQLAEQQRLSVAGKDEGVRLKAKGEVAKLEAELILLNGKRTDAEVANARRAAQAERELRDELTRVRDELLDLTGEATAADRRAAIERQYQGLIERLRAEGDTEGEGLVARLIDVKAAGAELAAFEREFNTALTRMRTAETSIGLQRVAGILTETQARERILALHRDTAAELDALLPKMAAAATAIGPEAVNRVAQLANEIGALKSVTDEAALAMDGAFKAGFRDLFKDLISGTKSASQALAEFAKSVLTTFLDLIARKLASKLTESLFGGTGGGLASLAGSVGGLFGLKFAEGGFVAGPGSGTSDSIPAWLSDGEYVVRAAAVRRVGVHFLDAVNRLDRGPAPPRAPGLAFAAGGLVAGRRSAAPSPPVNLNFRIAPEALHLTLRDWLDGELARMAATR